METVLLQYYYQDQYKLISTRFVLLLRWELMLDRPHCDLLGCNVIINLLCLYRNYERIIQQENEWAVCAMNQYRLILICIFNG